MLSRFRPLRHRSLFTAACLCALLAPTAALAGDNGNSNGNSEHGNNGNAAATTPAAANSNNGNGNAAASPAAADDHGSPHSKVTICHATGSASNPYVTITISTNGLNGHRHHDGDIIPAPAGGCPAGTSPGHGSAGAGGGGGGNTPAHHAKITICHHTGSATNPYVTITISTNGLNGHRHHDGDIIPAPAGGCPTGTSDSNGGGTTTPTTPTTPTPPDAGGTTSPTSNATVTPAAAAAAVTTPTTADTDATATADAATTDTTPATTELAAAATDDDGNLGSLPFTGAQLGWILLAGLLLAAIGVWAHRHGHLGHRGHRASGTDG